MEWGVWSKVFRGNLHILSEIILDFLVLSSGFPQELLKIQKYNKLNILLTLKQLSNWKEIKKIEQNTMTGLGSEGFWGNYKRHREQFICKFGSQFYHQTLIVKQCTLQIYIKQAMTTSRNFAVNLINACDSLFVRFSFVLVWP